MKKFIHNQSLKKAVRLPMQDDIHIHTTTVSSVVHENQRTASPSTVFCQLEKVRAKALTESLKCSDCNSVMLR